MAVAALESIVVNGVGMLRYVAEGLDNALPNQDVVIIILGFLSAIIDNVPLVAASMVHRNNGFQTVALYRLLRGYWWLDADYRFGSGCGRNGHGTY